MSVIDATGEASETTHPSELAPYWPSRVKHDRVWYQHMVNRDERFYDTSSGQVNRISHVEANGDVFSLTPCAIAGNDDNPTTETDVQLFVDNICTLGGAIEAGDLIHLPDEILHQIDGRSYITLGSVTIEAPSHHIITDSGFTQTLDPPRSPKAVRQAILKNTAPSSAKSITLYTKRNAPPASTDRQPEPAPGRKPTARTGDDVETEFFSVQPFSRWTFEDDTIRRWVESYFEPGDTVLNACAGQTKLSPPPDGTIIRNDINSDRDADYHVDVAELAGIDSLTEDSFDVVIFDPPWSLYQSNLRYESEMVSNGNTPTEIDLSELPFETPDPDEKQQLGHARLAKQGFDYLLKPGGTYIELTFHGTAMPSRMDYEMVSRAVFNPVGEAKAVIGSVDRAVRQTLTDFA